MVPRFMFQILSGGTDFTAVCATSLLADFFKIYKKSGLSSSEERREKRRKKVSDYKGQ